MNTRYLIAGMFLGVTACATAGSESPRPAADTERVLPKTETTEADDQFEVVHVPEVPVSANVPPSEDEIVCRKERRTGTYLAKKVCRTQSQMEAEREAGQDSLDTLSRRTLSGPDRD